MARTFGPFEATAGASPLRVAETVWPVDSYRDRDGYDPGFIPGSAPLPLPGIGRWAGDVALVDPGARQAGAPAHELRYTHFSVVMSRSRRLPLFSAVNIDGSLSDRDVPRADTWRRDPRIEADAQIIREVYGDGARGFFSRGHMTRREDPNWGDRATAERADRDTFHVTNAAPQQQNFNAGIWLELENYILDNTDRENLRISVITGPVLAAADPLYYGVHIPVDFWKIAAFRHGQTGKLTAIGYRRSQSGFLPRPQRDRFVFADFDDTQVSIQAIELDAGIDLAAFKAIDVMRDAGPQFEIRISSASDLVLER
ncbi:MAG: DNA/RNA non-specific endonuclease [Alphaproteobacteria bacterium]